MEYTVDEYKRSVGRVLTTQNGNKYIKSKITGNLMYLRCVVFRDGCKGTSKLAKVLVAKVLVNQFNHFYTFA